MKIVIDIPEDLYEVVKEDGIPSYKEERNVLADAIANGTPLPKGHGRLIDVNDLLNDISLEDSDYNRDVNVGEIITLENIDRIPTIIESDKAENKEYGVEVINRGNCIMCGKKLIEGLLFCKECEAKGK